MYNLTVKAQAKPYFTTYSRWPERCWFYAAFALAVINLVLWSYNLFVFLLLRVLPLYFDKIKTPPVDMAYTVVPIPKTNAN